MNMGRKDWWPETWGLPLYDIPGSVSLSYTAYRQWLYEFFGRFSLEGLARTQEPLALRDIYVPLQLGEKPVNDNASDEEIVQGGEGGILEWFAKDTTLFLSGPPGSGKTTLVRHVVSSLAAPDLNEINQALPDYLPIPLLLRDANISEATCLDDLVQQWLDRVGGELDSSFSKTFLPFFFNQGRYLILLDGLDEVGTFERRVKINRWVKEHKETQLSKYNIAGLYLFTSRPSGLREFAQRSQFVIGKGYKVVVETPMHVLKNENEVQEEVLLGRAQPNGVIVVPVLEGSVAHVQPFTDEQIETFCHRWFKLPTHMSFSQESNAQELLDAIQDPRRTDLKELGRRPSFLTMMGFVHGTIGKLPDTRVHLFANLVEAYLHMLEETKKLVEKTKATGFPAWPKDDKVFILAELGFIAQTGSTQSGSENRLFSWGRAELTKQISNIVTQHPGRFKVAVPEHAKLLVDYFLGRTGLLAEVSEGRIQFGHLSFQEYLAAVHLHAKATASRLGKFKYARKHLFSRLNEQGWEEVATFFVAIDAQQTHGQGHTALLAKLNLLEERQTYWLARLLGGQEISFGEEEVLWWIAALLIRALGQGNEKDVLEDPSFVGRELSRLERNREPFWQCFEIMCLPWIAHQNPLQRLKDWLENEFQCLHGCGLDKADDFDELSVVGEIQQVCWKLFRETKYHWEPEPHVQFARLLTIGHHLRPMPYRLIDQKIVPPSETMFELIKSGLFKVSSVYQGFNLLLGASENLISEDLLKKTHLGAFLLYHKEEIHAWNIQKEPSPIQSRWLSAFSILEWMCSQSAGGILRDSVVWNRRRMNFRGKILPWLLTKSRYLLRALHNFDSRGELVFVFDSLLGSLVATKLIDFKKATLSSKVEELSTHVLSDEPSPQLTTYLHQLVMAVEACYRSENPEKPLTLDDLEMAVQTYSSPQWIKELVDEPELQARRVREWNECKEAGLLPVELLQKGLADTSWFRDGVSPLSRLHEILNDIEQYCDDVGLKKGDSSN